MTTFLTFIQLTNRLDFGLSLWLAANRLTSRELLAKASNHAEIIAFPLYNINKILTRHEKLDAILRYMSKNTGGIPRTPDHIVKAAKLNIDKTEAYMILKMLFDDGYVYDLNGAAKYGINYRGIIFLDNGGYTLQHKIFKRKMLAEKVSDYVNIVVKPVGIITAGLIIIWTTLKILEFFGVIRSL